MRLDAAFPAHRAACVTNGHGLFTPEAAVFRNLKTALDVAAQRDGTPAPARCNPPIPHR
jgi:hypothetical protein